MRHMVVIVGNEKCKGLGSPRPEAFRPQTLGLAAALEVDCNA